jgi:hypothetical protein
MRVFAAPSWRLEHDPEKWIPVFGKDHASTKPSAALRAATGAATWRLLLVGFFALATVVP